MRIRNLAAGIVCAALWAAGAAAQTAADLKALRGLAPVSALGNSNPGKAALMANLAVTGAIQTGAAHQPLLLSFAEQQQQALRDAFTTTANASQLADGLGSALGGVYQSKAAYTTTDGGKSTAFTNVSPAVADVLNYANLTINADSSAAKYFFANLTREGRTPVSPTAAAVLRDIGGATDVFGKAYGVLAGSNGADAYGNSRPLQTEPRRITYDGRDFFGAAVNSTAYLHGPAQDLTNNPSYPSGHTSYGYTEALVLAMLVPQRYPELVVRAAEYGNDRIILGAHYAMDVLAGRTLAVYDMAQLLADAPDYVGVDRRGVKIDDFRAALRAAKADLTPVLEQGCGGGVAACAKRDQSRFAHALKNRAFTAATQTYGLPVVYAVNKAGTEDVGKLAPEAGYLLTVAFPKLSLAQADAILTATEGPGGGFLDDGSAFGVYSRLDLYRAAVEARQR